MRKVIVFIGFILLLVGCGDSDALSSDFAADAEQVLPIIKEAHKEQDDYSEKELDLLVKFNKKYKLGQYQKSGEDEYYEMNDVEKAVYHEIVTMYLYAVEMDREKETAVLASEKDTEVDEYKKAKETLEELTKIDSIEDLPKEFKNKYPTYEVVEEVYPEQFKKDIKNLLNVYEPIVDGTKSKVNNKEWDPLIDFLNQYKGDAISYPIDYKQNGDHYLINDSMRDAIETFSDLKLGIDAGHIMQSTIDELISIKETFETLDW
ncbi:hypothetical protein KK120_08800 [Virgibacillus dakarensis]|nr:hypothetical protein [Virgibacillus dakarensis]MBT2215920.1 hypothetical protein [Virgibacillus dakarensis]